MAIIKWSWNYSEVPEGAVNVAFEAPGFDINVAPDHKYGRKEFGPYAVITWHEYVGLCLSQREANGYHDSDFYMSVWDEAAGAPKEICFASTRGWSYPSYGSFVDASPEVKAKAEAHWEAKQHKRRVMEAWARRNKKIELARAIGESNYRNLRKLEAVVPAGAWSAVVNLLSNPRIRSEFKKSLKAQILAWYFDAEPKYPNPLSRRQWEYV